MAGGVSRTRFWYLFLVFTSYEGLTRCPHRRPMPPPGASPPVLVTREQGRTPGGLVCSARLAGGQAPATPPRALTSPRHGPDGGALPEGREHSFRGAAVGQPQPRAARSLLPASLCAGCNERVLGWEREGRLCQTASSPVRLHGYSPKPTASLTEEETEQGFLQHQSSKQLAGWHEGD